MQLSKPADQLVSIDVALGRPNGVYRPGDRITGHVVIEAKQDIPLCGKIMFRTNAQQLTHQSINSTNQRKNVLHLQSIDGGAQECKIFCKEGNRFSVALKPEQLLPSRFKTFEYLLPIRPIVLKLAIIGPMNLMILVFCYAFKGFVFHWTYNEIFPPCNFQNTRTEAIIHRR